MLFTIMASKVVKLEDELKEHGLTRDQLNTPCSPEVSRALAMKIDDWKLLAPFIGLSAQDIAAIQEGNRSYETQSLASLTRWRRQFGSKATYLMLAEGLEKIGRLDLVGELCVICKDTLSTKPKGELDEMITRFKLRFRDLVVSIQKELIKGRKVSMEDLLTDLTLLPSAIKHNHMTFLKENIPHLGKASNFQEIFMHLNLYWDYFNYTLLEVIITAYGSETLKKQMKSYVSDIHQFMQKTTVANFIPYCKGLEKFEKVPEEFVEVKIEINKPITEITLLELEELRCRHTSSYQLQKFALILYKLQEGSLEVTWLVATELQKQLKEALRRELSGQLEKETQQIVSISVGGECIKEMTQLEKKPSDEGEWECTLRGEKMYFADFHCDVLIIISSESLEGPDIVPRKKGCLTQKDKDKLTSQGIPPDCWEDDGKLMEARYKKDKTYTVLSIENKEDMTAEYVLQKITTLFKTTSKQGVGIYYIGPGRRNTGDWCFKDGFITFNDIASLYKKHFYGELLCIGSDCSYSGKWIKTCTEFLDEHGVQPCGHSGRATNLLLTLTPSCLPHQIPHSLLFSARGLDNDKNTGTLHLTRCLTEVAEGQHIPENIMTTYIVCRNGATFEDPCSLPDDYTWHKWSIDLRVWLLRGEYQGQPAWKYVFLVDDDETIEVFLHNILNEIPVNVEDYGQVLRAGIGQDPPDEVHESIVFEYKNYSSLKLEILFK